MQNVEIKLPNLTNETIESMIYIVRGEKAIFNFEPALIYGYETKNFNRQVKNNIDKFPEEFRFLINKRRI